MFLDYLRRATSAWGLELSEQAFEKFEVYAAMLVERNKTMNLTAVTEPAEVAERHFLDSLSILKKAPLFCTSLSKKSVIDVGTGAGFPGMVLKIASPDIELTLLDSLGKRLDFLREICEKLGLSDVKIVNARAEEAALLPQHRDRYDIVTSRAVAKMAMLTELCLPFARRGGYFLAMKSGNSDDEVAAASGAIAKLGGRTVVYDGGYMLPDSGAAMSLVVVEKVSPTPKGYPRRFAKIKQFPI